MAQQNVMQNPYGAPRAKVGDAAEEFQPVKLFAVSGRIGRARYIVYSMLVSFALILPAMAIVALSPGPGLAVLAIAYIAMFVMSIMLTIQRSHDFNMTGWFSLMVFVPFANLLFWFVPGTDGPNRFGAKTQPNSTGVTVALWIVPVVFVLGIAAAVALPAYQDYVKRAATVQTR
jgi:uncharacterized membrane protein YhaH (DUF805 family)